jgi:hypothetical protein
MSDRTAFNKRDAADALIGRAITVYLDQHDYLSVLVLAGSAEDLLAELRVPMGKGSAAAGRSESAKVAATRSRPSVIPHSIRALVRMPLDWLRHSRGPDVEAWTLEFDAGAEAAEAIEHAISNYIRVFNHLPPDSDRWDEEYVAQGAAPP